jgi:hypothetical protein
VQADDVLSKCGEFDFDRVYNHVNSKLGELEMHGKMAYDCPSVPTNSMKYLGKVQPFSMKKNVLEHAHKSL